MLKTLKIKGYRGISSLKIDDFSDINIFVGYNNCGKSTILESVFYLINPGNARLPINTNSFRDMRLVGDDVWSTYFNQYKEKLSIEINGTLKNGQYRGIVIKPRTIPNVNRFSDETIDTHISSDLLYGSISDSIKGLRSTISIKHKDNQIDFDTELFLDEEKKQPVWKGNQSEDTNLGGLYLNSRNTAADDANRFDSIQTRNTSAKKNIVNFLKIVEPSLKDIALGNNNIIRADIGGNSMIPVKLLGDGFGRALSIALAIECFPGGIVIIDEIENGISYNILEEFWKYIFKHSKRNNVQIFTATHSLETIRAAYNVLIKTHQQKDRLRVFRVEREGQNYSVIKFVSSTLGTSLEKGWEIR